MASKVPRASIFLLLWNSFWIPEITKENISSSNNNRMWKSICSIHNLTHFGFRKRMSFYLCLFIFYSIQLAFYRKGLNQKIIHDSKLNSDFLIVVDVLLLVISMLAMGCGWVFRPIFQEISVVMNSVIFGLSFAWLILAAPNAAEHQAYYGINGLIVLLLFIIDISIMFYVRPEIIAVAGRHKRKSLTPAHISSGNSTAKLSTTDRLRNAMAALMPSYGRIRHRFLRSEEDHAHLTGPMADKADEELGGMHSDKEEFVNVYGEDTSKPMGSKQSSSASLSSASSSPFHETAEKNKQSNVDDDVIYGGYAIDTTDKTVCEGFRVNMSHLPNFDCGETPRNLVWDDFSQIQHIVDSSSCHIYTATWKNNQTVVLKLIKAERISSAIAVAEFDAEEGVLSRIRHPNIVRFLGSGSSPRKFLVLELLAGGSLSHSLGLRADSGNQTWEKRFSFLETLDFALSLARALKYLHHDWSPSVHIIHRDLKPDNIGFSADGRVKLFDFGLCASVRAQREKTEQYRLTGNTGTLRYMAPEVVLGRSYHQSVDVYSFGILLWQVASGKVPFRDMGKKTYFDRVVVGGQRPRIDSRWPLSFAALLRACWHEDKHARPSFVSIVQDLESLLVQEEDAVLAQHNRWHRRIARHTCRCCYVSRPFCLLVIVALFVLALWIVIDRDDTVLGALLGCVSTFGMYVLVMSYVSVWPMTAMAGMEDMTEVIEQQRLRRQRCVKELSNVPYVAGNGSHHITANSFNHTNTNSGNGSGNGSTNSLNSNTNNSNNNNNSGGVGMGQQFKSNQISQSSAVNAPTISSSSVKKATASSSMMMVPISSSSSSSSPIPPSQDNTAAVSGSSTKKKSSGGQHQKQQLSSPSSPLLPTPPSAQSSSNNNNNNTSGSRTHSPLPDAK